MIYRRWGGHRQGVNDLTGPSVTKLLAGFFFDGLGLRLEGFDLLLTSSVVLLQSLYLSIQLLRIGDLLVEDQESVGAKDGVIPEQAKQSPNCCRRQFVAPAIKPFSDMLSHS